MATTTQSNLQRHPLIIGTVVGVGEPIAWLAQLEPGDLLVRGAIRRVEALQVTAMGKAIPRVRRDLRRKRKGTVPPMKSILTT